MWRGEGKEEDNNFIIPSLKRRQTKWITKNRMKNEGN